MNALIKPIVRPTAIIAEDDPLLALALQEELARAWPELYVVSIVGDGISAVKQAMILKPDVIFFDIRMPGMSGFEAAAELADAWQEGIFPSLVFVTAYDQYVLQALDAQAVDYVIKPVKPHRLQQTVVKLTLAGLNNHNTTVENIDLFNQTLRQLRHLIASDNSMLGTAADLKYVKVSIPSLQGAIRMVPIDEVVCFTAVDKYVQVIALDDHEYKDYLIQTPIKELIAQLDEKKFWQIHPSTIVRGSAIDTVICDEAGKLQLTLRGREGKIAISRLYAHLFRIT